MAGVERGALDVGIDELTVISGPRGVLADRVMEALERISGNRPVVLRPRGQQAGPRRLCQAPAAHPFGVERSPRAAKRAKLVAAASRLKSASTFGLPRTRARRPP